jgi:hypothetical protein
MDMVGLILLAVYLIILGLFVTDSIRLRFKAFKLKNKLVQETRDNLILMAHLEKLEEAKGLKSIEQTEGFMKFISESRDWAFTYIEEVQAALEEYRKIADVIPISKDMTVQQAEELSKAYDAIMSFLPEENLL